MAALRVLVAFGISDLEKLSNSGNKFAVISGYRAGKGKHENQQRHGELMAKLQKAGYRKLTPIKSRWEDMATNVEHAEKSILVPNMSFDDATKFMKDYDQDAVLYKDPSGSIGIYFKDGTATMAFEPSKADAAVLKSKGREEYSKGRSFSFGLQLVDDKKFKWSNGPITKDDIVKEISSGKPKEPEKSESKGGDKWEDFVKEKYEGGEKKVPNPNPDSKETHPEVTFNTALKDEGFEHQVRKEFQEWAKG
jgi:hypothetical protein